MFSPENLPDKVKYISLLTAANYSGFYSQEYLSLRARQGKLKAVKVGRNWVTTKSWVDDYIHNDHNFKANGTVYSFSKKEEKEDAVDEEKIIEEAVEPVEQNVEASEDIFVKLASQEEIREPEEESAFVPVEFRLGEASIRPDELQRGEEAPIIFKVYKKVVISLGAILIFFGLIAGVLILKSNVSANNFLTKGIETIKKQANDAIVGLGFKEPKLLVDKGMIVIPSKGETEDEKIKQQIRDSFSDEVEVQMKDSDSGIITPVFREKKGENYMYLMVPIKN